MQYIFLNYVLYLTNLVRVGSGDGLGRSGVDGDGGGLSSCASRRRGWDEVLAGDGFGSADRRRRDEGWLRSGPQRLRGGCVEREVALGDEDRLLRRHLFDLEVVEILKILVVVSDHLVSPLRVGESDRGDGDLKEVMKTNKL